MEITIEVDNKFVGLLPYKIDHATEIMVRDSTFTLLRFLQESPPTPVDTGFLRSFYIESLTKNSSSIKSPANYAEYQDKGTRPHIILPKIMKALYWEGALHPVKIVNHPGFQGKHFVNKSFTKLKPLLKDYFIRGLKS